MTPETETDALNPENESMKGRKPKPTYMRVLEGTRGHAPLNHEEPIPETVLEAIPIPEHLTESQQVMWRGALKSAPDGMLRDLDYSVLEAWVTTRDKFLEAKRVVDQFGVGVEGDDGQPKLNPMMTTMRNMALDMVRYAAELGFTPSSRSRVRVDKKKSRAGSPFSSLKRLPVD